jgi:hypothetical protein
LCLEFLKIRVCGPYPPTWTPPQSESRPQEEEIGRRPNSVGAHFSAACYIIEDIVGPVSVDRVQDQMLGAALVVARFFDTGSHEAHDEILNLALRINRALSCQSALARDLASALASDLRPGESPCRDENEGAPVLAVLNRLVAILPERPDSSWWTNIYPQWDSQLRSASVRKGRAVLSHRDLNILTRYCRATALLAECLASARGVSRAKREAVIASVMRPG